jgi:hypothetical protein
LRESEKRGGVEVGERKEREKERDEATEIDLWASILGICIHVVLGGGGWPVLCHILDIVPGVWGKGSRFQWVVISWLDT